MTEYSKEFLIELYKRMLEIRLCEESFVEPILNGEIKCPVHLCSGQEAVAVGVCEALGKEDYIFGNHRSHGHYLAKGGSLSDLIAEVFCKGEGCSRGKGGSMHLIHPAVGMMGSAPIVAGTISLAVGAGMAAQMNTQRVPGSTGQAKMRKSRKISVSFFGDGATNEGVLFECLNFAAVKRLPVLFVCENNLYSTHMPIRECRPNDEIFRIAEPFDIPAKQVDGNDVIEVYEAAREAVSFCRNGKGPYFLECLTYRLRGHVGPDDNIQGTHTDIRPEEEVKKWKKKDPILRFERYLVENDMFSQDGIEEMRREVDKEVEEAFVFARGSAFPDPGDLHKYVFAE